MDAVEAFWWIIFVSGWFAILAIGGIVYHVGEWIYNKWRRSRSRVATW